MITEPIEMARRWETRERVGLWFFLVVAVVSSLILGIVLRPPGPDGSAVELELARDATGFADVLATGWRQAEDTMCGLTDERRPHAVAPDGEHFGTLRCHLFVDSVGFVPGYVGLLTIFTLLFARVGGIRRTWVVHALCVPAIAAGLFDIAENGMTVLAADNLMRGLLADATVLDVRLASLWKWSLVATAFVVLAVLAWRAAKACRSRGVSSRPLLIAAIGAALCGLVLGAGLVSSTNALLAPGMLAGAVALALLAWWRLRNARSVPALVGT